MTTTYAALQAGRYHRMAWVIVIEGLPVAITTGADADLVGLQAAWADTDWDPAGTVKAGTVVTTWYNGAFMPGEVRQEIEFLEPTIVGGSHSFTVQDQGDELAALSFAHSRQTAWTFLTADINTSATTIPVQSTTTFSALTNAFPLYLGNETIIANADGRDAAQFRNCNRGYWQLHQTSSGNPFGRPHLLNTVNLQRPIVSSACRSILGRTVHFYLHNYADGWNTQAEALPYWSGRITDVQDNGNRTITFTCEHIAEMLNQQLFERQFTAELLDRFAITAPMVKMRAREHIYGRPDGDFSFTLATTTGFQTVEGLIQEMNAKLVQSVSSLTFSWSVAWSGDGNVQVKMNTGGLTPPMNPVRGDDNKYWLAVDARIAHILGFDIGADSIEQTSTGSQSKLVGIVLEFIKVENGYAYWGKTAPQPPLKYIFTKGRPDEAFEIPLTNATGTWTPQPVLSTGDSVQTLAEGYVMVGDLAMLQGYYDSGNASFVVTEDVTNRFAGLGFNASGGGAPFITIQVRRGQSDAPVVVKQVWYERAPTRDVLLRLLLSTGSGYNHGTYDVNPYGMSMNVPYELLDYVSFFGLGGADFYTLIVTKPTQFLDTLRSILVKRGRHLVWRQGLLSMREVKADGPTIAGAYTLDEDNKASPDDRPHPMTSKSGLVNRLEIKARQDMMGEYHADYVIEDTVSSSDLFHQESRQIEIGGVDPSGDGLAEIISSMASKILGYFSRPLTYFERTITKAGMHLVPTDTVIVTDPYVMHPVDGTRGITNWPCWVKAVSFDPGTMSGRVQLATSTDLPSDKIVQWGHSALVDHSLANAGYVVVSGSSRYLGVLPYQYDDSTDGVCTLLFAVGDKLLVRERSPVDPYNATVFHVVVESLDHTVGDPRIYLTATITGWDSALKYIIVPEIIGTAVVAQRATAFIADDADNSIGLVSNDAYLWGAPRVMPSTSAATLTQQFVYPPQTYPDTEGYPVASGDYSDLVQSLNSMLAYRTRHMGPSMAWTTSMAYTSGTSRELIVGPVQMPCYGWGSRTYGCRLRVKSTAAATATFFVTTARQFPVGTSMTTVSFPDSSAFSGSFSTTSTTFVWANELAITVYPSPAVLPPTLWFTVEAQVSSGVAHVDCIQVFERELT